jgi:peptidoglycan-associated lipoprotein
MKRPFARALLSLLTLFAATSCNRSSDDVWNDTQSAGRHMARGIKTLAGYHGESRQINSSDEFDDAPITPNRRSNDFVGFEDDPSSGIYAKDSEIVQQPNETPGESGSSIPGIDQFKDPELDPELVEVFKNVHFDYNSSLLKGDENFQIIAAISDWLKTHPNVYIFVSGHCDSRGPAAYNFALGANRANAVRNMLIKEGISYDRIFTISYGKERPLVEGEGEEIWRVNRRGQFKVYEKN